MTQLASDVENESRGAAVRSLALWLLGVLVLWIVAHSLNRWLLFLDESTGGQRFAYWTGAKLIAWLGPTWLLLRQRGRASVRWLGLATAKGLGIAVLCCGP